MTTKKGRSKGTGNIRERRPGVWQLTFTLAPGSAGTPGKKGFETITGTRGDAEQRLRQILGELDQGTHVRPSKQSLSSFMAHWMETYARPAVGAVTADGYAGIIRRCVEPSLGRIALGDLRADHILDLYTELRSPERQPKPLGEQTLLNLHRLLKEALGHAVRWRWIARNPAADVDSPRPRRRNITSLNRNQHQTFLEAIAESTYRDVFVVDLNSGLRRSEILGLRWPAVDLDEGCVAVLQGLQRVPGKGLVELPVKSDTSRRVVYLDDPIIELLRRLKVHQIEQQLQLGHQWDGKGFVFCRIDGSPFDPAYVSRDFTARMKQAGLTGLTLHGLRHTNVSGTIASSGLKAASDRAGHSSVQITGDIYGHVEPEQQRAAARKFTEYMSGGGA